MEIKAHFPHRLKNNTIQEIEQLRKDKLYLQLRRLESKLEFEINDQIDQLDSQILDYYKPLDFNPANPEGYIVQTNKNLTYRTLTLKKRENDIKSFTVLEFYTLLDMIEKEVKVQKEQEAKRNSTFR